MTSLVVARGIHKSFQNGDEVTEILRGIDVTLEPGELVALVGPSGSGKSTLLSIVGLLLRQTIGDVTICGERVDAMSDAARADFRNQKLGFIFQFHHLLPDFTACENVAFPAAGAADRQTGDMLERARALLGRVGLAARADFRAGRLSGGQKQRVAIARAMMNRPSLILADEPTGNLDRDAADQVLELMRDVNREERTTFLICTHDEHVAARCSRRITLVDGRVS